MEQVETDLETDLIEGRIDALLTPSLRDNARFESERQLRSVIADAQSAEQEYLEEFGVYPINHVIVVRNDVLSANPDLPAALVERFSAAKQAAYRRRLGVTMVPWADRHWKKTFDFFAGDPLPYGLTVSNRLVVGRLVSFLFHQQLISTAAGVDSLFVGEDSTSSII